MSRNRFRCNDCGDDFQCATALQMVEHFKKEHPDDPEECVNICGITWDDTLTRLVNRRIEAEKEVAHEQREKARVYAEYQKSVDAYEELRTKLNAIKLVLR